MQFDDVFSAFFERRQSTSSNLSWGGGEVKGVGRGSVYVGRHENFDE